jgi:ABC-type glycerol-3-phosphate transport system substrate-binding protein
MGWTFDELMSYADEHPRAAIFDSTTQSTILYYSLLYNENSYIDWENADCHFDSDEFKKVLEFANRFPEDWEWDEDDASEPTKIQNGEVLLSNAYFYDFDQMQLYIEMFGGDVTCIGYPTSDGSAGCGLSAGNAYAITTKSAQKEGAWAFLEDFLADSDGGDFYNWGFPSNKEALNKMVEEATAVEYVYNDDGSPMLDDDGEPITIGGGGGVGYQDGWSYTYRTPTQEEVDQVLALMEVARPMGSAGDEIYNIINEEAEAYFKGQKSVDEVADIIQSRVKIYVSENS